MKSAPVAPRATTPREQAALVKALAAELDRLPPRAVALAFANFVLAHAPYLYPHLPEDEALRLCTSGAVAELAAWVPHERAWLPGRLAEIFACGGAP